VAFVLENDMKRWIRLEMGSEKFEMYSRILYLVCCVYSTKC
jgi:hypothetical protein